MSVTSRPRDPVQDRRVLEALVEALRGGRYEDGVAQAEAMLADGLIHPLPLRLAATVRQQAGRFEEAIALFQNAIERAPRDPSGWAALAACYFAARRPEAALEASQAALALAPHEPALICGRAQLLESFGRADEAAALYRQALTLTPGLFEAQLGLARLAIEAGRWDEADSHARALEAQYGAHSALGWLAARIALGQGDFETARARTAALLDDKTLPPIQRAEALLLRGQALDALGRTAEAFQAAIDGKTLQHDLFAERAGGREGETAKLRRLADWFRGADPAAWRDAPPTPVAADAPSGHVFLVGFPRSGTTLLEQILAGHPEVVTLEEAPTLAAPYTEYMTTDDDLERLEALTPAEAALWRARYWAEVRAQGVEPAGKLFVDKAPAGTLYLPLVAKLFPDAKILFALRNPRDVVLSCLRHNFQLNAMTYAFTSLAETAACYDACMDMAEVYRAVLPLRRLDVRHEALVEDFDASLAEIAAFLDLTVSPQMADIAATAQSRQVRTPSADQVRQGLNTRGLARWRAYERQIVPVKSVLAPWIERFDYPAE